jgi:hypothetical protein
MPELVFPMAENCESEDGPFSMSVEERMRQQHDIVLPVTKTDNKSAIELKAEFTASNIDLPLRPNLANLRALADANNKSTTKRVDNRVHRDKTIEELKNKLANTGFSFEHRNYRLRELQDLSTARNIAITITHHRVLEGWCGKPKGLLQVLFERGKIDPAMPLQSYKKNGAKGKDFEDNGDLKEESKPFILTYLLSQCSNFVNEISNFANEISDLQQIAAKLSGETGTVTIGFTPKYHFVIAGEGIEFCWGFAKKLQRRLPIKDRRKVEGLIKSAKCYLKSRE